MAPVLLNPSRFGGGGGGGGGTPWTNHVTILANAAGTHTGIDPSNPTAQGVIKDGSGFTPTAGRLLVCFAAGPVTSSTPSGWTLPAGGSSVNTDGLYAFYKTAAGGDTLTTSHNSGAYLETFDFYEFASTYAFAAATAGLTSSGATRTLSGLTGTNVVLTAVCSPNLAGTWAWTGATPQVDYDTSTTGSHHYGLGYTGPTAASSVGVAATLFTHEQVMIAVK